MQMHPRAKKNPACQRQQQYQQQQRIDACLQRYVTTKQTETRRASDIVATVQDDEVDSLLAVLARMYIISCLYAAARTDATQVVM